MSKQKISKSIEILAFDKDHNLQYEGLCKLSINRPSKLLLIEPFNEEFKLKSALFSWKFLMEKNILFIFGEHDFQGIALVFNSVERCKKAFDAIHEFKPIDMISKTLLFERLLNPIFQKVAKNDVSSSVFKVIMKKWLKYFTDEEEDELVKFMKEKNVYDQIYLNSQNDESTCKQTSNNQNDFNIDDDENQISHNSRKRKHRDKEKEKLSIANDNLKHSNIDFAKFTKIIKHPNFKLVNTSVRGKQRRAILIFTEKDKCYEYSWVCNNNIYGCRKCRHKKSEQNIAILENNENGYFIVKMKNKAHTCDENEYVPKNYNEVKIIRKPDYKLLENCAGKKSVILIIFNPNDRSQCYEYVWDFKSSRYCCRGCVSKKIKAKICKEGTIEEYVEIENDNHTCRPRQYDPEKYGKFNAFVLKPDFEIAAQTKGGKERNKLIIFDSNNRKLCYIYFYQNPEDNFQCSGCNNLRKKVTAKLNVNADGEEYVILSTAEHVCELRQYEEILKSEKFLRPPDIELCETNLTGFSKLLVFASNDKSLCYVFGFPYGATRNNKKYQCLGCAATIKSSGKRKETKGIATCYLYNENNDDNYYVRMTEQPHCCVPRNYEAEKNKIMVMNKTYDFFLFRQKNKPDSLKAALIHPKTPNLCYKLSYRLKSIQTFYCGPCATKKHNTSFLLLLDENGKEYFDHDFEKHVCKPLLISKIKESEIQRLESSGLHAENSTKKTLLKIDEAKLIKMPDFELCPNKSGTPDARLIVFHPDDKSRCYEYYFMNSLKYYVCCKCASMKKNSITAKLHINEDGEKCIILGKNEHICEAVEFSSLNRIIVESPNFATFELPNKPKKLVIFTSSDKDICYEYRFVTGAKQYGYFRCHSCYVLSRKSLFAKIHVKENGEEYVHLLRNDHVCTPQKFIKEKFQSKSFEPSQFLYTTK